MNKKRPDRRSASPVRTASWIDSRAFAWVLAVVYLLILLALFSDFVFSDRMLYGSDTLQAQVYMKDLHREHFHWLDILRLDFKPKWTPYLFGGMPFVDSFNSDILNFPSYPFKFLFPIPLHRALGWVLILHFWLAGMGMYWAAHRGWGLGRLSSAVAGLGYMLAPYLISMVHPGHDGKIFVVSWFPLGFLFLKRIWDTPRLRDAGLFALIVGVIILTPHVQMAYFSLWAYAAYSVYRIVISVAGSRRVPWLSSAFALGAVVLAVGMSAWQFYPGYYYVKHHSPRAGEGRGFDYAASWSLHPEEVVSEVVADFSGVAGRDGNTYWGRNFFKDNSEYGGLVVLLLALFGVFRTRFPDRWFFFGLGCFAALYGLGAHTPIFKIFYYVVPNVKQMRAPSMIMFLYLFGIALCAGAAVDALLRSSRQAGSAWQRVKLLWITAAFLGACALLVSIAPSGLLSAYTSIAYSDIAPEKQAILDAHLDTIVIGFWLAALLAAATAFASSRLSGSSAPLPYVAALCALILVDGGRMDRQFIQTIDFEQYYRDDPVLGFLRAQQQPFRVLAAPGGFPTNYFALKKIPEMTGYHGNQLRSYNTFLGGPTQPRTFTRQALDLASVEYLIFRRGVNISRDPQEAWLERVYDQGGVVVFRNQGALPWVRLVTCWELRDPGDSLYARLLESDFDYRHCVIVEEPLPFASANDSTDAGQARIVRYDNDEVEIGVDANREALLVFAENIYPAWHAQVDGEPAKLIRTDATFRGVVVPPGRHTVLFRYRSDRLQAGARITVLSGLLAVSLVVGDIIRHRRRRGTRA